MSSSLSNETSLTRIGGSTGGKLYYPSPFFDIASQYMPKSPRDMFGHCAYYYKIHPVIHQCITQMATYPITNLVVEDEDTKLAKRWEELFNDHLKYKSFLVTALLDKYTYGNAIPAPFFPFVKTLTCTGCKAEYRADAIMEKWTFSNFKFRLECPKCGKKADAKVEDRMPPNIEKLKLIRWNPADVLITGSEYGEYYYFYEVPKSTQNSWVLGQKHRVVHTPQEFITGVEKNKLIIMNQDNLFHMKRAGISGLDSAYGIPLMMPLFKDAFLFQIFKKSMEMLILEHAVPWRLVFPQAASAAADPSVMLDMKRWKKQVEATIHRWKLDHNFLGVLPFPLGQEKIGGDAKVFLMGEEIRKQMELLVMGMGAMPEFIFGGLSWQSSSVSLKKLENQFINDRSDLIALTKFLMKRIGAYIGWRPPKSVSFRPFKMADDLQRKMYRMQLNQAHKVSDTTLLLDDDLDSKKEDALIEQEGKRRLKAVKEQQLATAEIQAEIQATMQKHGVKTQFDLQKYQQRLQKEQQETTGNIPTMALDQQVQQLAGQAMGMQGPQQQAYLQQLSGQYPELGNMVGQMVQGMQSGGQGGSMMKPMPEQRAPRRLSQ